MAAPRLVLLAAGASRRFGRPKQLEPVGPGGATLPAYAVVDALAAGFERVVVVTGADLEGPMREALRALLGADAPVDVVVQPRGRTRPWGTAHAVLAAAPALDGAAFGVANGDDWYGPEAHEALRRFLGGAGPGDACLVSYEVARTLSEHGGVSRGRVHTDDRGRVVGIDECRDLRRGERDRIVGTGPDGVEVSLRPDEPVSMNLWGFPARTLDLLDARFGRFRSSPAGRSEDAEFLLSEEIGALARDGSLTLSVVPAGRRWFGLTHPADLDRVRDGLAALHEAGCYRWTTVLEPGDRPCN